MFNTLNNVLADKTLIIKFLKSLCVNGVSKTIKIIKLKNQLTSFIQPKSHPILINYSHIESRTIPFNHHPVVSIIIPAYNQWDYTYACIASVIENAGIDNYEIILADDNSSDETINATKYFINLKISRTEVNLGFLKNCNQAAQITQAKYIVFLNNDTQVQTNWLKEMLALIETDEQIGMIGSKLVYANGMLQEAGAIVWQNGNACNYGRLDNPDKPEYNYVKEVDYISGASIMLRTELWHKVGGFDQNFTPAYCEDSDLAFEIRALGFKVVYCPFSVVLHHEGISHGTNTNGGIKQYQILNIEKFKEKWKNSLQQQCRSEDLIFNARDRSLNKKTVLVIDHDVPTFDKDAGSRAMLNFLSTLCDMQCNVKFMSDNFHPTQPYTSFLQKMGIEVLYGKWYSKNWQQFLITNAHFIDFLLLSRAHIGQKYLKWIKHNNLKIKTIYCGHDLGFLRLEQQYALNKNNKLLKEIKFNKNKEAYMYKNSDYSLVFSTSEIDKIRILWPATSLKLIPAFFFPINNNIKYKDRNGLLFVGGFNHLPNVDAMLWFLDDIYDYFNKLNIKCRIVGSAIPASLLDYQKKYQHLEFYNNVSDIELDNLYHISKIAIVPLRIGAGIKAKVIEAMSKGVPTIGTSIAYDGLINFNDLNINSHNDVPTFKTGINELLYDNELWTKISNKGLEYIKHNFNPQVMQKVFTEILIKN